MGATALLLCVWFVRVGIKDTEGPADVREDGGVRRETGVAEAARVERCGSDTVVPNVGEESCGEAETCAFDVPIIITASPVGAPGVFT